MGLLSTERDIRKPLMVRCCDVALSRLRNPTVIMRNSSYKERVCFVYSYKQAELTKFGVYRGHTSRLNGEDTHLCSD